MHKLNCDQFNHLSQFSSVVVKWVLNATLHCSRFNIIHPGEKQHTCTGIKSQGQNYVEMKREREVEGASLGENESEGERKLGGVAGKEGKK